MSNTEAKSQTPTKPRNYVSQQDVPGYSLEEALRIPKAISDEYARQPTGPLDVAKALDMRPSSGGFRGLAGAAIAWGLTEGGPYADRIAITDLGLRIVRPVKEGDDQRAKLEALMKPRVIRQFLNKYDQAKVPSTQIGKNVLEGMGVPAERTARTLDLIISSAEVLGVISEISGQKYINLKAELTRVAEDPQANEDGEEVVDSPADSKLDDALRGEEHELPPEMMRASVTEFTAPNRKVFISHGGNRKIVGQLKELLTYGDFEPVVSVEKEATARPVPEKVLADMRSCTAGIIHVGPEKVIVGEDGEEHALLNYNVLIEIGAGMALYDSNYILLVKEGTKLPSNLQGLYEVRYSGDTLDHGATMKLLRAFKEFKS